MNLKEVVDFTAVIGAAAAVVVIAVTIWIWKRQVDRDRRFPDRANFNGLYSPCYSCFIIVEQLALQQKSTHANSDTKRYTIEDCEPILLSIRAKIKEIVSRNPALEDLSTSLYEHMVSIKRGGFNIADYERTMVQRLNEIGKKVD